MSNMYQFVLNMWVFRKINEDQVKSYVTKGFITLAESEQILATPQA